MALSIRDRKVQLAVAGAVVAILAVFLLVKALGGSGTTASPESSFSPAPAPSVSPSVSPTPPEVIVFSGRDPFQDLFGATSTVSPTVIPTTSPTSPGTSSSPPPSGGVTTPPPSGGGNGGNGGDGGSQGSETNVGGHSVLLDDVFVAPGGVRKAQVEVDGTVYTVAAGESFDGNFKLVSFPNASCAHFVYGDEGFTLCTSGGK